MIWLEVGLGTLLRNRHMGEGCPPELWGQEGDG